MAATDIKHIYKIWVVDLGAFLKKCFKILLQGNDLVAQVGISGTKLKEKWFFSFYSMIIY